MWERTHCKEYQNVTAEAVWDRWGRVNEWHTWHGDLDYCKLEGPFEVGNHFILKPKGSKSVKITLTEIEEGKQFTDCTVFPGAKMYDTHKVETIPGGVRITNRLVVTGLLKWIWIKLVAQEVAKDVLEEVDALVELARGACV